MDNAQRFVDAAELLLKAHKKLVPLQRVPMPKEKRQELVDFLQRVDRLVYELYEFKYKDKR